MFEVLAKAGVEHVAQSILIDPNTMIKESPTLTATARAQPRWAALVALLNLAFALFCHLHAHQGYVDHLNTVETLYLPGDTPTVADAAPPMARRTWVLIIDGLRADAFATMPQLQALASTGVQRTLVSELPSFTYPSLTTLVTGIEPFYSGIRLNGGGVLHRYDTLLAAAARSGVASVIVTERWTRFDTALDWKNAPRATHATLDELVQRPDAREIAWVHVLDVDTAGHRYGARSREYRSAALHADEIVGRLAAALDLSRDAFVVLSDHGHLSRGGHGGPEADARNGIFVAAGIGIARDQKLAPARLRDVCATLAMLAGVAPPVDNLGSPMTELLLSSNRQTDARLVPSQRERRVAESRLIVAPDAIAGGLALRRAGRRPWAIAFCALFVLVWIVPRQWRPRVSDAAPMVSFTIVFAALYAAAGYRVSWSLPRGYAGFAIETALFGLVGSAAAVVIGRWRWTGGPPRAVHQASFVFLTACAYAVSLAQSGSSPAWLEGPHRSFVLVLVATASFYAALCLGVLALLGMRRERP